MEGDVGSSSRHTQAAGEGIHVVHGYRVRHAVRDDLAPNDQRDNGDAYPGAGGEQPDQKDEGSNASPEERRNVDSGERVAGPAMKPIVRVGLAIDPFILFGHIHKHPCPLGDPDLIGSRSTNVSAIPHKVNVAVFLCGRSSLILADDGVFPVALASYQHTPP